MYGNYLIWTWVRILYCGVVDIINKKAYILVADKGELSDEDVETLEQIQIMFCIPKQTVEAAHPEICGGVFEKIVKEAIASGVDGYDGMAAFGLRLTKEVAMSIASYYSYSHCLQKYLVCS